MMKLKTIVDESIDVSRYKPKHIYNSYIKRTLDLISALVLLVVLSPVFVIVAVAVKLSSSGPVFYRGIRTGYRGKKFRIFKFRSMVVNAESLGGCTTGLNDPRITSTGMFIRKTKIDEFPQLLNIIIGDMSFVGPRPEVPQYTDQYTGEQKIIFDVRPGITDISSLYFINLDEIVGDTDADDAFERLVLPQKIALRMKYVVKQSLLFDAWLVGETVRQVIIKALGVVIPSKGESEVGAHKAEEI